jgi:hypothetical protein
MIEIAVVGSGPYGLSIAAHLRHHGIPFRIFGRPMDSWISHMPKGMLLKSDGFASNLYDADHQFSLRQYCADNGIEYSDAGIPVRLETFSNYGLAFQRRMVPDLEQKLVVGIDRLPSGFHVTLDDGETVEARRIVLAVGITNFEYLPTTLAHLPKEFLSHSYAHQNLEQFRGRSVAVIGAGASAVDLAGLLHDIGADVQLIARQKELKFHSKPSGAGSRSWWQKIRHPQSGLGPGLRSKFFADAPLAFHYLPEGLRIDTVRMHLGPSGGWFSKEKVVGRVPTLLGYIPEGAEIRDARVSIRLRAEDGTLRNIQTSHVIAATGYRVDTARLGLLNSEIIGALKTVNGAPVLSSNFESSVPGLYFTGLAAGNSFGPAMRFAFGAGFASRHLTHRMVKSLSANRASVAVPHAAGVAK